MPISIQSFYLLEPIEASLSFGKPLHLTSCHFPTPCPSSEMCTVANASNGVTLDRVREEAGLDELDWIFDGDMTEGVDV
jgi:hypothetical protein